MIVVTGATGQVGFELKRPLGDKAVFLDRGQLDLNDIDRFDGILRELKPSLLINAAACTKVDLAESDPQAVHRVNAEAPIRLAEIGQKLRFKLIHISSDYVFDGGNRAPYKESDAVHPINAYGQSKADGEAGILAIQPDALILRTSWLYSSHGHNFVKIVLRCAQENKPMRVVYDQLGTLTWAKDLAEVILKARDLSGIYHFTNEGVSSWYDVAWATKKLCRLNFDLEPILSKDYPTPAKRPAYSVLDKTKIKSALNIQIPHWMESLEQCLKELF